MEAGIHRLEYLPVKAANGQPWSTLFTHALSQADHEMAGLLASEAARNAATVNLIASESYCPRATIDAEASMLVNKNASGYPGRRDVAGCEIVDRIERLACARARRLFGADHANVQSTASTLANVAVLRALLDPGDRILSLGGAAGGHHSHGASHHVSGQDYEVEHFGVDEAAGGIDIDGVRARLRAFAPKIMIVGSTAYPRAIDFASLAKAAHEAGAFFFADIAHVAGLVAAGLHDNPASYSDVVTTSTHKTLCGPRTGGLVLCRAALAEPIDEAIYPGLQGAPGAHIIAGRAVLLELVARPAFRTLMQAVVDNARALAEALRDRNMALYLGGTDTHMVVVDLGNEGRSARAITARLEAHGLLANPCALPAQCEGDRRRGLRLGTTAMTIRGMGAESFTVVADLLADLVSAPADAPLDDTAARRVAELAMAYPIPDGMIAT